MASRPKDRNSTNGDGASVFGGFNKDFMSEISKLGKHLSFKAMLKDPSCLHSFLGELSSTENSTPLKGSVPTDPHLASQYVPYNYFF